MKVITPIFSCLVFFFLMLNPSFLFAQEIQWGEKIELKENIFEILGENDQGIYAVGVKGRKFYVEHFDSNTYEKIFSKEIIIKEEDGLKTHLAKMLLLDENLIMLTFVTDNEAKEVRVYAYLLDENGNPRSERKTILKSSFEKKSRSGYQDIRVSRDHSKLLVCNSTYFKNPAEHYKIDLTLYSADLEPIQEASAHVPISEGKDIEVSNFFVENDGSFFMALSEKELLRGRYITRKLWIYSYMPFHGFEEQKLPIELSGKTATSIALTSDLDGNLIGSGFYGERFKSGLGNTEGLAGSYFIKIDPVENVVLTSTMEEFPKDFTAQVLKEKQVAKGRLIPNFFDPLEIIGKSDGGAVMISEYYYEDDFDNGLEVTHGPLAIVDIAADGSINWVRALPKEQFYAQKSLSIGLLGFLGAIQLRFAYGFALNRSQTVYHSALFGTRGDKLIVLYNDHPKNQEITHMQDVKILNGYLGAVPVVVEIDAGGNMKKSVLRKDKREVILQPGVSLQVKPGETLLYGTRKKQGKIGRIRY